MAKKKHASASEKGFTDKQKDNLQQALEHLKDADNIIKVLADNPDALNEFLDSAKKIRSKTKEVNSKAIARERWINVGARRINQVLMALNALEKCAHPYNYNYTEKEVQKMFEEIENKILHLKKAFMNDKDDLMNVKDKIFDKE